jgi:hypothetical protein
LSLPGLTIGLLVWLFSTQVISNAASASIVSTSPHEHQPHVDPSPSSLVRYSSPSLLARTPSFSSSFSSESSEASNSVNKKKTKRKNNKKKIKQGSKPPTTVKHVGKQLVTITRAGNVDDVKITQTNRKPKNPYRLCKGSHILKECPSLSKVIEAWSTHPRQPTSLAPEQHDDKPPSTSHDTVGKKKSRVKFPCMLCKGSHLTHLCPHMDEASKLLEDMTVSQPQLPAAYRKLSLNPPIVDGMISLVPSSVNPVDHVVNLVTSLVEPVDKVVDPIPSSVNLSLPSESETKEVDLIPSLVNSPLPLESVIQAADLFPPVDPILPLENVTQVIDPVLSSVDPTPPLTSAKVIDLVPSSVNLTLPSESETQVVDPFPLVDPILPLENETQVVDLISTLVDPTLSLESKLDTTHVFLVDTESPVLRGIPSSPIGPPPSNETIHFDWGVLTRPRLPSHIPFQIIVQVCGRDVPQKLIDEGSFVSILSSIAWQALGYPPLAADTQNLLAFNRRTSQPLGTLPQFPVTLGGKTVFIDVMVV